MAARLQEDPTTPSLLAWRTWNVNYIEILEIGVYSSWDLRETVNITQTSQPPHMERNGDRGSHRTHRTVLLIENTSLNQDQIKTNRMEEFPYLLWRTKRLRRRPSHLNGENPDPDTSLPVYTQDTVPVDLVKSMVAHVSWGSRDTYHLWY